MLQKVKSLFSVFLLGVFLFPSLIKEVHTVNHEKRVHCEANEDKHFHEEHHECTLCDCSVPVVFAPATAQYNLSQVGFAEYIFPRYTDVYFSSSHFSSGQLRGPPAVS